MDYNNNTDACDSVMNSGLFNLIILAITAATFGALSKTVCLGHQNFRLQMQLQ